MHLQLNTDCRVKYGIEFDKMKKKADLKKKIDSKKNRLKKQKKKQDEECKICHKKCSSLFAHLSRWSKDCRKKYGEEFVPQLCFINLPFFVLSLLHPSQKQKCLKVTSTKSYGTKRVGALLNFGFLEKQSILS